MGHKLRTVLQDSARLTTVQSMALNCAVITCDFMCKWLPLKRVEAQNEAFGKSGSSCHGINVIVKCLPPELEEEAARWDLLSEDEQADLVEEIKNAGVSYTHASFVFSPCLCLLLWDELSPAAK
jgi:hypothetical protein